VPDLSWRRRDMAAYGKRMRSCGAMRGYSFEAVRHDADLVALCVSEVGAKVVGVVLGPQAWLAFASATEAQGRFVDGSHDRPVLCCECHHLTVASLMRQTVEGLGDHEERSGTTGSVPAGPGP
jgi:hypothetical protein